LLRWLWALRVSNLAIIPAASPGPDFRAGGPMAQMIPALHVARPGARICRLFDHRKMPGTRLGRQARTALAAGFRTLDPPPFSG